MPRTLLSLHTAQRIHTQLGRQHKFPTHLLLSCSCSTAPRVTNLPSFSMLVSRTLFGAFGRNRLNSTVSSRLKDKTQPHTNEKKEGYHKNRTLPFSIIVSPSSVLVTPPISFVRALFVFGCAAPLMHRALGTHSLRACDTFQKRIAYQGETRVVLKRV